MVNKHILAAGSGYIPSLPLTLVRAPFYITFFTWPWMARFYKQSV